MGLRTSYKEDLKATAAEMLYGTPLRLPGEFFLGDEQPEVPDLMDSIRSRLRRVRPIPTAHHTKTRAFTFKELLTCTHAFVRIDRTKTPLEMPYEGPYEILERLTDRIYKLNIKGKPTQISTERLKPAFIEVFTDGVIPPNFDQPILQRVPASRTYQGPSQVKNVQFVT